MTTPVACRTEPYAEGGRTHTLSWVNGRMGNEREQIRREVAGILSRGRELSRLSVRGAARIAGVPAATVQGWLSGRYLPTPALQPAFEQLAEALGVAEEIAAVWGAPFSSRARGGDNAPYMGLRPFTMADAGLYFGREAESARLARFILDSAPDQGIVVVLGASGSGKSSLLAAGLAARQCGPDGLLAGREPCLTGVRDLMACAGGDLIVVDQFEEALVLPESSQASLWRHVAGLGTRHTVVLGVRSRALEELSEVPELAVALSHPFVVAPMTEPEFREAVRGPARARGVVVEPALVDAILHDMGRDRGRMSLDVLPLLSNVLLVTWSLGHGGSMRLSDYQQAGGLAFAVQRLAEETYEHLTSDERQAARRLFLHLVQVVGDTAVCTRVNRDQLSDVELQVAIDFVRGRILVGDAHELGVGHESLIRSWPRLASWVDGVRSDLHAREHLRMGSRLWIEAEHADHSLLPVGRLPLLESFLTDPAKAALLGADERSFLEASRAHFDSVLEAERSVTRALRRRGIAAFALAFACLALATVAVLLAFRAVDIQRAAQSRQLAIRSYTLQDRDPNLRAQIALVGESISRTTESTSALLDAASADVPLRWLGPASASLAVSSEQGAVLRVSGLGRATLWRQGELLTSSGVSIQCDPDEGQLYGATFLDRSAETIIVGGVQGFRAVWDVAKEPTLLSVFGGGDATIYALAADPTSTRVAAALSDGTVEVWGMDDPSHPQLLASLAVGSPVRAVTFTPDGRFLYAGGAAGQIVGWVNDGFSWAPTEPLVYADSSTAVTQTIAVSPDGHHMAAGLADKMVIRFELGEGVPQSSAPLTQFDSWINSVAFTPDSSTLMVGSSDLRARVVDWNSGETSRVLPANAAVTGVALVEGHPVVSLADGALWVWPPSTNTFDLTGSTVYQLAASQDGRWLAGALALGDRVVLWESSGPSPTRLEDALAPEGVALGAGTAMSPRGDWLIAGTRDGQIVAWRLSNGRAGPPQVHRVLPEGNFAVLAASPDGTTFASLQYTGEQTVLWRIDSTGAVQVLATLETPHPQLASFNADGSLLQVGIGANAVLVFDVRDPAAPTLVSTVTVDSVPLSSAFDPNSRNALAIGTDGGAASVWDLSDVTHPRRVAYFADPHAPLNGVSFGVGGATLFAAAGDGRIWGWGLTSDSDGPLFALEAPGGQTWDVRPVGGDRIASATTGMVRYLFTEPQQARADLCGRLGDGVTADEWQAFLPGVSKRRVC